MGCFGDGGACFTNDEDLSLRMREVRHHGQSQRYYHTNLGINGRFDTLQAAVLLEKMPLFPEEIKLRHKVADGYAKLLGEHVRVPIIRAENTSVYAQYTLQVNHRDTFQAALNAKGIPTAIHYPLGLHLQPIFKQMYPEVQSFPNAEAASCGVISLPMHPYLKFTDQQLIAQAVLDSIES